MEEERGKRKQYLGTEKLLKAESHSNEEEYWANFS